MTLTPTEHVATDHLDGQAVLRSVLRKQSPANDLASAVIEIMRIAQLGPYSPQQIQWWNEITQNQGDQVEAYWGLTIDEVCCRIDQRRSLPIGTTKDKWIATVLAPCVLVVAKILEKVSSTIEHAPTVRHHLAQAGLSPEQAATRLLTALPAINKIVAEHTGHIQIKDTLAHHWVPGQYTWLQNRHEYKEALQALCEQDDETTGEVSLHPVATGTWRIMVRSVNVVLNAPIRCTRLEIDVMNRFWPEASVKLVATMLTHPTIEAIDRLILKTIAQNRTRGDVGILATQKYLEDQSFDGIAAPLFIVNVLEKTPHMDKTELANAFVAGLGGAYRICGIDKRKLGTLVWNTVPAPWLVPPQAGSLPMKVMDRYKIAKHKIDRSVAAIANAVRETECNTSMASINLTWDRTSC